MIWPISAQTALRKQGLEWPDFLTEAGMHIMGGIKCFDLGNMYTHSETFKTKPLTFK